jgi:hypothetical protein
MERVQALIHKLAEQQKNGATPEQLLVTVQLLQQELSSQTNIGSIINKGKISVVLPTSPSKPVASPIEEEKEIFQLDIPEGALYEEEEEEVKPALLPPVVEKKEEPQAYAIKRPTIVEEKFAPKPMDEPKLNPAFNLVEETPTTLQQQRKEVHEAIGEQKESLNDRLKQDKTELAHVLKESPIKDLRKGIGVNDKFLFLNELFRGDEAMYERSLKTINAFHILPEAEYWINRELKVKLGWNDTNETVQHFYQLVRRRFS